MTDTASDARSARPTEAALAALLADLDGIRIDTGEAIVRQKSRDYYWYSPVLKERLDGVLADLIVTPADEAEVIRTVAACHRHDVPLTARGRGTGNYGQAMPLAGGVVLNLADMADIVEIAPGRVTCGPGAVCEDIDVACRAHSGQELRMHPSTGTLASIGGFVAGGSGGIGSTRWGGLRDAGNVLRLRVVTMEAEPRVLELTGDDVVKVIHAYGTNGIITEVEMPLTAAYEWVDVLLGFDDFMDAAIFCDALANQDGILVKLNCTVAAPAPEDYFRRHRAYVEPGESLAILMVAPQSLEAALAFARRRGARVAWNAAESDAATRKKVPPVYQLTWNHTTLRALKEDSRITYLQVLYPFPHQLELVRTLHERFAGEVIDHLEFVRFDGDNTCFGLPLVRYTTEARLDEIVEAFNAAGAPVFNPHRYTLEEGGMKRTDAVQLAFKRDADPKGLLNPGKMIGHDDPDHDYDDGGVWLFEGLAERVDAPGAERASANAGTSAAGTGAANAEA